MTGKVYRLRVTYDMQNRHTALLFATAESAVAVAREYINQNAGDWFPVNGNEPDLESDCVYGFWQDRDSTKHYVEVQEVTVHSIPHRPPAGFNPTANLARMLKSQW